MSQDVDCAVQLEIENENIATEPTETFNMTNNNLDNLLGCSNDDDDDKLDESQTIYPIGRTAIYVLNLPPQILFTFVEELTNIFNKYGEIKSIKRGGTILNGLNLDFTISAYVVFKTAESPEKALAENGTIIGGNPISVNIFQAGPLLVKLDNLPVPVSTECLKNLLQACGTIKEIWQVPARRVGKSILKFASIVEFENEEGLNKALTLSGKLMVNGIKLSIKKIDAELMKSTIGEKDKGPKLKKERARAWDGRWQPSKFQNQRGSISNRGVHRGGREIRNYRGNSGRGHNNYNTYNDNYIRPF
ncbi:RNA-binding protein 34-like [Arctopsyche grandis]|uniref:RNA-binding protein 34-like n=1 Tax=Arctopsyche grandis TaxID=121162 RepID=UPI00406D9144